MCSLISPGDAAVSVPTSPWCAVIISTDATLKKEKKETPICPQTGSKMSTLKHKRCASEGQPHYNIKRPVSPPTECDTSSHADQISMTGLTETDGGATRQMFPCCLSAAANWSRSAEEASQRAAEPFLQLLDGDQRDVCRGGSQMPPVGTRLWMGNGYRCCLGSSGPSETLYRGFVKWFRKYTVDESHLGIFRAIPSSHKSNYIKSRKYRHVFRKRKPVTLTGLLRYTFMNIYF